MSGILSPNFINKEEPSMKESQFRKSKSVIQKEKNEKLVGTMFQNNNKQISIGFFGNMCSWFYKNPKIEAMKKQQKKGIQSIFEKLDVTYILNKFHEIDKLKLLLLDKNQLQVFEYLPKPMIMKNGKIHLKFSSQIDKSTTMLRRSKTYEIEEDETLKARNFYEAFHNINKKPEKNDLDLKLIDLLEDNLKNFFLEFEKGWQFTQEKQLHFVRTTFEKEIIEEPEIPQEKNNFNDCELQLHS